MHTNPTDTGVSPEDEWIYESVKQRFAWPKKELSVSKMNFGKRFSGGGEGKVDAKKPGWGTRTGPEKLEMARKLAAARNGLGPQELGASLAKPTTRSRAEKLDRPYGGKQEPAKLPDWMDGKTGKHPMLPLKPPGKR